MGKRIAVEHIGAGPAFRLEFAIRAVADRSPFPDCRYVADATAENGRTQRVYFNNRKSEIAWEPTNMQLGAVAVRRRNGAPIGQFVRDVFADPVFMLPWPRLAKWASNAP